MAPHPNSLMSVAYLRLYHNFGITCIGVPLYRNLPFGKRATRGLTGASSKKGKCTESPPTFIQGKRRKDWKRCGLRTLSVKGSGVVFTHGEGISTPRVRHKGRQPLIKCANMTSICFIFPFTFFMPFIFFFIFLWSTRVLPFAPTYSSIGDEKIRPT